MLTSCFRTSSGTRGDVSQAKKDPDKTLPVDKSKAKEEGQMRCRAGWQATTWYESDYEVTNQAESLPNGTSFSGTLELLLHRHHPMKALPARQKHFTVSMAF